MSAKLNILIKYVQKRLTTSLYALQLYTLFMTKIEHTNIIVDNFSIAKSETNRTYTHILTHIHTGIPLRIQIISKDCTMAGPMDPFIAQSRLKRSCFTNFQTFQTLYQFDQQQITLPLQTPTEIKMSGTLSVTVTFFDANHCIGGVMVLIQGYMGRVLYTGDMRFDLKIFKKYSYLYPADKWNQKFQGCSKKIDILYLDNTFLKKKFNFPPKQTVLKMTVDYMQELLNLNKHKRVFIGLDSFGKQEVLVELATHFSMYIVVDQQRYQLIRQTPLDLELFTTNKQEGVVEVVRKDKLYSNLNEVPDSIGIILSGWVNHPTYRFNQKIYCLPYSLHSNYEEIHQFVNSIRPSFIYPIVHQFPDQNRLFYAGKQGVSKKDLMFNQNLFQQEQGNYKHQIEELRKLYASPPTEQYKILSESVQLQKKIDQQLRPPNLSNLFTSQKVTPLNMQVIERKKYKICNNRNQLEINRLKNQIKLKKKIIEGIPVQSVEDIDAQSLELSDSSKNKIEVIALDGQDQAQTMKEDVIEIDPLFQPINNIKSRPWGVNQKRKNKYSNPLQRKSSKQVQKSSEQLIQQKSKNRQHIQKVIQLFKKENKSRDESIENLDIQGNQEKTLHQPIDIQKHTNKSIQCQSSRRSSEKQSKDMGKSGQTNVLGRKEQTMMRLKRARAQLQLIRQILKEQQKSNK